MKMNAELGCLIEVLLLQSQFLIVQPSCRTEVPSTIREECSCIKQLRKSHHIALLHLSLSLLEAFNNRLVADGPVTLLISSDAENRGKHVLLADCETTNSHKVVLPSADCGLLVTLILRKNRKSEKFADSTTTGSPGTRINLRLPIIVEDNGPLGEVETISKESSVSVVT